MGLVSLALALRSGKAPIRVRSMERTGVRHWTSLYAFAGLVLAGLALRILIVALPGNELIPPWSGPVDTPAYVTLAENLLAGRGLSYAGQPSAFRPPGYPFLLAGMMWLFGSHYVEAVRWLQFALGLATVYLCARVTARMFGEQAWSAGLAIALLFPTLFLMTGNVLTECTGAFLSVVFLHLLVEDISRPRLSTAAGLGLTSGLAVLFRSNMAVLVLIALGAMLRAKGGGPRWRRAALMVALAGFVVAPWAIRNLVVFRGQVLFSTQGGLNAAVGILTPQGRTQPGDTEKVIQALGWFPPQDLENEQSRSRLPSEPELNRQGWSIAWSLFKDKGWRLLPLGLAKLGYFWLSTDQLFSTQALPLRLRLLRGAGVLVYWLLLLLAVRGWFRLREGYEEIARVLSVYAVAFTALHLPFVMNTRLRVPLMDPLLAILASGGWLAWKSRQRERTPAERLAAAEPGWGGPG